MPPVAPTRYVLLPVAAAMTGYTVKAMERKIESGVWRERSEYVHAPDGRIMIDVEGYHRAEVPETAQRIGRCHVATPVVLPASDATGRRVSMGRIPY